MLVRLRRHLGQWLTSGGYLALLFAGGEFDSTLAWRWIALLIAGLALSAWLTTWGRLRAIADLPTSRIGAAAQGYVELLGRGTVDPEATIYAPLKGGACLWYRYRVQRRQGDKWVTESSGESDATFLIDDASGVCRVYPLGAEVLAEQNRTWTEGDHRYTLARLDPGERIYVLGDFSTVSGATFALSEHADVRDRLAEWKRDPARLLQRFDLNGNGEIDLHEWELARAQARREVQREHAELRSQPSRHSIGAPEDGRLYLISSLPPERIEKRFRRWAALHLLVFFAGLAGHAYLWST